MFAARSTDDVAIRNCATGFGLRRRPTRRWPLCSLYTAAELRLDADRSPDAARSLARLAYEAHINPMHFGKVAAATVTFGRTF